MSQQIRRFPLSIYVTLLLKYCHIQMKKIVERVGVLLKEIALAAALKP